MDPEVELSMRKLKGQLAGDNSGMIMKLHKEDTSDVKVTEVKDIDVIT